MKNHLQKREETLTVMMPTEVDHYFVNSIREEVDRKIQTEEVQMLAFDFQKTEFMDSSGIGLLMGRYKLMRALGGKVQILYANERIRKILILSGIYKIIPMEGQEL